jgi:hypothetical protein
MAKLFTGEERITVVHPELKEVKVHCRVPEPVEATDVFSRFQQFNRAVAVIHPVSGELVHNTDGTIATITQVNIPSSEILKTLENFVLGWEGLEDENEKAIPFEVSKLKLLFSRELTIKHVKPDPKDPKKTINTYQAYGDYIQEQINKKLSFEDEEETEPVVKKSRKSQ